jgi:hypothetical protein
MIMLKSCSICIEQKTLDCFEGKKSCLECRKKHRAALERHRLKIKQRSPSNTASTTHGLKKPVKPIINCTKKRGKLKTTKDGLKESSDLKVLRKRSIAANVLRIIRHA